MKIAHFFTVEYISRTFDTKAEVSAFEAECGVKIGDVSEVWQTEDGEVFSSAAEAEQHARALSVSAFDWDGFSMKAVEAFGLFPA